MPTFASRFVVVKLFICIGGVSALLVSVLVLTKKYLKIYVIVLSVDRTKKIECVFLKKERKI